MDHAVILRDDGTTAYVATRTYEQAREQWQGQTLDLVHCDTSRMFPRAAAL